VYKLFWTVEAWANVPRALAHGSAENDRSFIETVRFARLLTTQPIKQPVNQNVFIQRHVMTKKSHVAVPIAVRIVLCFRLF